MNDDDFNIPVNKARVLVAPLDWGLGHATRCLPVISKLLKQHCEVFVAAENKGKKLIEKEFPDLNFIDIQGYQVKYSRNKMWMPFKILVQMPGILYRVYAERRWLKKAVDKYRIDAVISDNRPGLHHPRIPCIYITHQLQVKTGNALTDRLARLLHYHFINKFTRCWVPDAAASPNLAGELAHPSHLPKTPVTYIGPLSRFEKTEIDIKYDCCIVLSGPEPPRTILEQRILKELNLVTGRFFLVRGLPAETPVNKQNNPNIEIENHLPAAALNRIMQQSGLVICRSGYTSIMDLVKLNKRAVLVPTPGQTEQEYLARYMQQQSFFPQIKQEEFTLSSALEKAKGFSFKESNISLLAYQGVMDEFVKSIQSKA